MMALMSPKAWMAIALSIALAFSYAFIYRAGKATVRADWNKANADQLATDLAAEQENRRMESLRTAKVIEAQNANTKRNQALQIAAAGAAAQSSSLRDDLAAIRADVSSATLNACRARAAALTTLLGDMEAAGAGMAGKAQGHANDSLMYQEGWPK